MWKYSYIGAAFLLGLLIIRNFAQRYENLTNFANR